MTVKFTKRAVDELKQRGATDEIFKNIADTVVNAPRKPGLDVDASDNYMRVFDFPLSFTRSHKEGVAYIMTLGEAEKLDDNGIQGEFSWIYTPK